jgi:hypothetical protein
MYQETQAMRPFTLATIVATATALGAVHANAASAPAAVPAPFSRSEFVNISAPGGSLQSFTSSVTATAVPTPEPVSMAILGGGLLCLGLLAPAWHQRAARCQQ